MHHWKLLGRLFVAGLALAGSVLAQKAPAPRSAYEQFVVKKRTLPGPKTICYLSDRNEFTKVLPPDQFLKGRKDPKARKAATANIIVTYSNFSPEAQQAFQYAVDIWANLISSPIPIRIQANWTRQDRGVLGSAGPSELRVGTDGTQKAGGVYPIALAEKIARRQLNNPDSSDIEANFNQNNNWYYGLDAKPGPGQYDLVTVVLHEIGHGLGFIGFFNAENNIGEYSVGLPAVYDHFIENSRNQRLVAQTEEFPDGSRQLYQQLTGGNLFLNGPNLQQRSRERIRLYAPSRYDQGSSIYHVDENTYEAGDTNSLMSPSVGAAEAIHTPGPLVLNFFRDMEWRTTSLLHDNEALTLELGEDVKDVNFRVRIVSDTAVDANSLRLFYRKTVPTATDTTYTSVTPTLVAGTTDTYIYTLPAAQAQGDVYYYFQIRDVAGLTYTNPGKSQTGFQLPNLIRVGPDNTAPTVRYSPARNFLFNPAVADSLPIAAYISDDRQSIDTAYVEYQVNGQAGSVLPLRFTSFYNGQFFDSLYTNTIQFPANTLKSGDVITYRIVARDSSRARNQTINPTTGNYEFRVATTQAVRDSYVTTFDEATAANSFVGYGFSVATPAGFANPAIQSEHPYRNGSDYQFESNYEYVLLSPIRLKANPDSAVMRYDEVVLVEPGEENSQFGDSNFFDYVIVEGSRDNGRTWYPFIDGYDSRDQADWLRAYNRNLVAGSTPLDQNSNTPGTSSLYKRRSDISLIGNGNFRPNDEVLIRFRLFADQFARGWGWAIDNLQIQVPPPPPVLAVEPDPVATFSVYPNPVSNGIVRIEAKLAKAVAEAGLTVTGQTGQTLRLMTLKVAGTKLDEQIDLSQLPTGMYFLKLKVGDSVLTKKMVIAK